MSEQSYLNLLAYVRDHGRKKNDRTGVGTTSVFGQQMRFDLSQGFPLLTTKKMHIKSIFHELLWFLKGDTNIAYLQNNGVRIWNEWADESGDLGPVYGQQWRAWQGVKEGEVFDQISRLVHDIKHNPDSRRLIVSAWNVGQLQHMALPPCHLLFQCYVSDGRLSCQLYQRSADLFLGVPFNIASYALLTHMLAQQCNLLPGEFIWCGGDCHIYDNHLEQVAQQLERQPFPFPSIEIKRQPKDIFSYQFDDFQVNNYKHHATISAPVAA